MADNFEQLSDDAPEPMQVDQTSERRTLRKRKEKLPKHLKRGVNSKEMDVGTEICTVDFRLNKETRKTLISQRSRISANTTRQAIRTRE
ncbi:hypothetical protein F2Q68_00015409 [Brassica cretica]|uniref:Shugoshin C-terminal domain-containing protein n=2 Tax=Brassica cretica TaxID=69181 RepID=A0ABQ7F229_BRACR|nr:hypothetical protein F2Q68_00015409 [Brassica cretica]KAF3610048.1 hypothetical protein DY000_02048045 [Brassica cretica]